MKKELTVEGMTCGHCKMAVEKALSEVDGVVSVNVDLDAGKATVECEPGTEESALAEAVREAGYEVV